MKQHTHLQALTHTQSSEDMGAGTIANKAVGQPGRVGEYGGGQVQGEEGGCV